MQIYTIRYSCSLWFGLGFPFLCENFAFFYDNFALLLSRNFRIIFSHFFASELNAKIKRNGRKKMQNFRETIFPFRWIPQSGLTKALQVFFILNSIACWTIIQRKIFKVKSGWVSIVPSDPLFKILSYSGTHKRILERYKIRATQITREFVRYKIRATKKYKRVNEV